jgi:hypothetical protein
MVKSASNEYGLFYANRGTVTGPYQGFQFTTLAGAAEAKLFFGKKSKKKLQIRRSIWIPVS